MIEEECRGWSSCGDKYVCKKCLDDYALQEIVTENAESNTCNYCNARSRKYLISARVDKIIECINEGIASEWSDPDSEGIFYESAEGGYQAKVKTAWEMFNEQFDYIFKSESLKQDVMDSFTDQGRQWCQRNYYQLKPADVLKYGWEEFSNVVKHKARYLVSIVPDENKSGRGYEEIPPGKFLEKLGEVINTIGMVRDLKQGTRIFRSRVHTPSLVLKIPNDLGPPPIEAAIYSNRMSPAGIPMFYGAFDADTAVAETYDANIHKGKEISTGKFITARDIKILDLTHTYLLPSIFDISHNHKRPGIIFMRKFKEDLSKPIKRDGKEHIEYVPTQVITEYFRKIYKFTRRKDIRGILYNSSIRTNGKCCVLYFEQDDCCLIHKGWKTKKHKYGNFKWWLGIDKKSIKKRIP